MQDISIRKRPGATYFDFHAFVVAVCQMTVFCLAIFVSPANAGETLVPLHECPASGPNKACLPITFRLFDAAKALSVRRIDNGAAAGTKIYRVKGRLSGREVQAFELKITQNEASNDDDPGVLPYRGRSAGNHPVILTDRGSLEILSEGFDADLTANVFIIDEAQWTLRSKYLSVFEPHFIASHTGAELWIKMDSSCVSAPRAGPGLLKTSNEGCRDSTELVDAEGFFDTSRLDSLVRLLPELSYLKDYVVSEDGHFVERDWGYASAARLRGTRLLVVRTGCGDCY